MAKTAHIGNLDLGEPPKKGEPDAEDLMLALEEALELVADGDTVARHQA